MSLKTISKPSHNTDEVTLHRPDGLGTLYHARRRTFHPRRA